MEYIILILVCSIILTFNISILVALLCIYKAISTKNDIELAKIELSVTPSDNDFNLIDKLIHEEVNKYHALYTEPNNITYINEEYILKMSRDILKNILLSLSNSFLTRLSYIYNIDKLEDIIYQKIQMAVIAYSVEVNSEVKEE